MQIVIKADLDIDVLEILERIHRFEDEIWETGNYECKVYVRLGRYDIKRQYIKEKNKIIFTVTQ